jgi:hypothetical protein
VRRRQAGRDQYETRDVTTAGEEGTVTKCHVHVPAATGQWRLRERLRGPGAAFAARVRPRAQSHRKRAQNRPSDRLIGTPECRETAAGECPPQQARGPTPAAQRRLPQGRAHGHAGPPQGTAAEGPCWLQRGHHDWLQMRPLERGDSPPSAPPDGPPSRPLQRLRRRFPRQQTRARTVRRDAPEGLGTGPRGRTKPCDAWLLGSPRSVCSREGLTSVFAGGFDGCQRR